MKELMGNGRAKPEDEGRISLDELELLLETIGLRLSPEEVEKLTNEAASGVNAVGSFDFQDFCDSITRQVQVEHTPTDIAKSFQAFARNAPDGMIEVGDIKTALSTFMHRDLNDAEIEDLLRPYGSCFVKLPGEGDREFFKYKDYLDLASPDFLRMS